MISTTPTISCLVKHSSETSPRDFVDLHHLVSWMEIYSLWLKKFFFFFLQEDTLCRDVFSALIPSSNLELLHSYRIFIRWSLFYQFLPMLVKMTAYMKWIISVLTIVTQVFKYAYSSFIIVVIWSLRSQSFHLPGFGNCLKIFILS